MKRFKVKLSSLAVLGLLGLSCCSDLEIEETDSKVFLWCVHYCFRCRAHVATAIEYCCLGCYLNFVELLFGKLTHWQCVLHSWQNKT